MNDPPHVRFVDAHPKGHGGHDALDAAREEVVVRLFTVVVAQSGMICSYGRALGSELLEGGRRRLDLVPRRAVDEGGAVALAQGLGDVPEYCT